jgi:hypothetical protein
MPIQCANCGAQYRLPETFRADKAKCKKCGAQIDVAAQRDVEPAAAPAPAPERRAAPARATAESRRPSSARATDRRRGAEAPRKGERKGSHRGHQTEKRGLPVLPIALGVIVLAGGAVAIWGLGGGDEAQQTAQAPAAATPAETASPRLAAMRSALQSLPEEDRTKVAAFLDATATGRADASGLREVSDESMLRFTAASLEIAGAGDEAARLNGLAGNTRIDAEQRDAVAAVLTSIAQSDAQSLDAQSLASRLSTVGGTAATPAATEADPMAKTDPPAPAETPKAEPPKPATAQASEPPPAGPFDPKTLEELPWPEFVTQEERDNIGALMTRMRETSGAPATRARKELETVGPKVLVGIANALREIDYHDCDQVMFGYELNQLLRAVTGRNAGYRACALGSVVPDKDAEWNARTVKVWYDFAKANSDPAAFAKLVEEREKKKAEEEKND